MDRPFLLCRQAIFTQKNINLYRIIFVAKHNDMKSIYYLLLLLAIAIHSCTAFKAIKCGDPSTDTFLNFALDTIEAGDNVNTCLITSEYHDRSYEDIKFKRVQFNDETLDEYFSRFRGNGALLVVRNDTILLERYYGNFSELSPSNIFSVTKAVTALLCGIAADENFLSITDPITKYIPELNDADPAFQQLTIEHLLDMRSGLDFNENYGWNPFSQMANLYYGKNVVGQFKKLHFKSAPGSAHEYNSMATALLGVAIERAVGRPFAQYLQEKVWQPLDMEADAYITLDDNKHRQAKAYGGLVTNVRDLAKIGRLYINGGIYNGKTIVSKDWIYRSTHSSLDNDGYSFGWYNIIERIDGKRAVTPSFFALGLYGQVLYCDPRQNLVIVTLGENKGCEYQLLFDDISHILAK